MWGIPAQKSLDGDSPGLLRFPRIHPSPAASSPCHDNISLPFTACDYVDCSLHRCRLIASLCFRFFSLTPAPRHLRCCHGRANSKIPKFPRDRSSPVLQIMEEPDSKPKRAPRKHVTTACVPCRESKIRVGCVSPFILPYRIHY